MIMLVYAAHVFDDNILYFCSKISKKLYIIGNVYANIKSSSEGGCRLIKKKKCDDDNSPLVSPFSLPSLPLLPSSLSFPPSTPSLHYQNNVC